MQKLTLTDLQFVVARIPKDLLNMTKEYSLFIGGGFVRETIAGGKISDIDVFSGDKKMLDGAAAELVTQRSEARSFRSDNAVTVLSPPRLPVQFIFRWLFQNPQALVESFDFTVCQAAIFLNSNGNWDSWISDRFYSDLAARRLFYTFPVRQEEAGGSLLRTRKFLQRGYNIQAESLAGVVARIAMSCPKEKMLDEKVFAKELSDRLREVDPLTVIDGIDVVDEHEIL